MNNPFRRRAEAARQEVTEAEAKAAAAGVTVVDLDRAAEVRRLARIGESAVAVLEARERAAEAEQREQARDEAVAAHAAAVVAEADRIAGAATVLEASRKRLTGAVKAADKALAALVAAGVEHDALVQQTAGELRAAGLVAEYRDADEAVTFDTGGTPAGGLVLNGSWWTRLQPQALAWRALYGALCGHQGAEWPGSREIRYGRGVDRLERQTAGLLDGCPLPAPHVPPVPSWQQEIAEAHRAAMTRPAVKVSARDELDAARDRHAEEKADRQARAAYAEKRAELVAEKGEDHVRQLEERLFVDGRPFRDEAVAR